jgi:hypothetical protein
MLVAKISARRALALEPQSTVKGPFRITGRLVRRGGHYLVTDETKPNLTKVLGQHLEVTGSAHAGATPATGVAQVIEIAQVTPVPPASGSAPAPRAAQAGRLRPVRAARPAVQWAVWRFP